MNLNYSFHPSDKLDITVDGIARRQDADLGTDKKQKLLLSDNTDIYKLYRNATDRNTDYYKGHFSLALRPKKGMYGTVSYSLAYNKDADESNNHSLTSLYDITTNDSVWQWFDQSQHFDTTGISNMYVDSIHSSLRTNTHQAKTEWQFALGDNLLVLNAAYDQKHTNGKNRQQYVNSVFGNEPTEDRCKNVYDTKLNDAAIILRAQYDINYIDNTQKHGLLSPYYSFSHEQTYDYRTLTQYDSPQDVGHIDTDNTRKIKDRQNAHTIGVKLTHEMQVPNKGWFIIKGELPIQFRNLNIRLLHELTPDSQRRQYTLFSPWLEMKWHPKADADKATSHRSA